MRKTFADTYTEFAVLLLTAAVIGVLGVRLRQPLIVSYIVVGIALGPPVPVGDGARSVAAIRREGTLDPERKAIP